MTCADEKCKQGRGPDCDNCQTLTPWERVKAFWFDPKFDADMQREDDAHDLEVLKGMHK